MGADSSRMWKEPGRVRVILSVAIVAFALIGSTPLVWGQEEDRSTIDELKEERERVAREAIESVAEIDVHSASVQEVTDALDEIAAFVQLQQARLDDAEAEYDSAVDAIDLAKAEQAEVVAAIDGVKQHISNLAVASFTGESGSSNDQLSKLVLSDDPGESARFLHLLEQQTGNLQDSVDRLRYLEVESEILLDAQSAAAARAQQSLLEVEERAQELQEALERQELVVAAAELRLEAQLAEAAFLQERDAELATAIRDEQSAINNRIASAARAQGVEIPPPVDLDDIVLISFYRPGEEPEPTFDVLTGEELPGVPEEGREPFFQIEVNRAIEEQTRRLYELAFSQGIDLGGWGYRPIQRQVELRTAHCGGSAYDIWHKPAFECAPPTARPGFSKHEQGRAIDFQWNGGGIRSRNSDAFRWLAANAPQFGFVNLPSEPWHWSIDEGNERLGG